MALLGKHSQGTLLWHGQADVVASETHLEVPPPPMAIFLWSQLGERSPHPRKQAAWGFWDGQGRKLSPSGN